MALTWESLGAATWKIQGSYVTVFVATGGTLPPTPYTLTAASNPAPAVSALASGATGTAYSVVVTSQPGTSPFVYTVTSGALPTGLSLNSSTGAISGTPSAAGTYTFNITGTDANGHTGVQGFTITVGAPSSGGANFGFAY